MTYQKLVGQSNLTPGLWRKDAASLTVTQPQIVCHTTLNCPLEEVRKSQFCLLNISTRELFGRIQGQKINLLLKGLCHRYFCHLGVKIPINQN